MADRSAGDTGVAPATLSRRLLAGVRRKTTSGARFGRGLNLRHRRARAHPTAVVAWPERACSNGGEYEQRRRSGARRGPC